MRLQSSWQCTKGAESRCKVSCRAHQPHIAAACPALSRQEVDVNCTGSTDCYLAPIRHEPAAPDRRAVLLGLGAFAAAAAAAVPAPARADDFVTSSSGLKYLDLRPGEGASPSEGDTVVVHWAGYTKGYQGKRIDNTSARDEPYEFVLGSHQAIPAFEEAVRGMRAGGIRRVEVRGEIPELSYPRDRSQRFTNELVPSKEGKIYRYRFGPQPVELGGQRALDFVLDNTTLNDLNRTLLFDIKLLAVRKGRVAAAAPPSSSSAATCSTVPEPACV